MVQKLPAGQYAENNPLSFIDPMGLKQACGGGGSTDTYTFGANGSVIAFAGLEGGIGLYSSVKDAGTNSSSISDFGIYVSAGAGAGVNVSAGVQGSKFEGEATSGSYGALNVSASILQGSGSSKLNTVGAPTSYSGGLSAGPFPVGASITHGGTVYIPITIFNSFNNVAPVP